MDGWMDGWMGRWLDDWIDGWASDGRVDEWVIITELSERRVLLAEMSLMDG
jgi:hypothetical protein